MHPFPNSMFARIICIATIGASPVIVLADDGSVSTRSVTPGTIEVASDGNRYTNPVIPLISLNADVRVVLDAGVAGKVKSWKVWGKLREKGGAWIDFSDHYDSATYSVPRPKSVDTVALFSIPYGSLAPIVTGLCNAHADKLKSSGLSSNQIFGQDRNIEIHFNPALSWEMTGPNNVVDTHAPVEVEGEWVGAGKLALRCKAAPKAPARDVTKVTETSLLVQGVTTLNGACKLNLSGVIRTEKPNAQVRFRYKDDAGHQSDIKTVFTDHSAVVMFNHKYDLAGTGPKQGKVRIDVVDQEDFSTWEPYNVSCNANAPGGVKGTGIVNRTDVGDSAAGGFAPQTKPDPNGPVKKPSVSGVGAGAAGGIAPQTKPDPNGPVKKPSVSGVGAGAAGGFAPLIKRDPNGAITPINQSK